MTSEWGVAMKLLLLLLVASCAGWTTADNPVSQDYPCGTRAHACTGTPLTCCWNGSICGSAKLSGCPDDMCCADDSEQVPKLAAKWRP